jgi:hypothetical protein
MTIKTEYDIKDRVWIHLGEQTLVEGRVVEIIDLDHLNEGHSRDHELYVIEIPTPIEPVYEVRTYDQISPDPNGPIMIYRHLEGVTASNRLLKKVGVKLPDNAATASLTENNSPQKKHKHRRYYKKNNH